VGQGVQPSAETPASPAAPPDVFVSYARKDRDVADRLCAGLEAAGKEIWIDREDIPDTADWRARARAGVETAKAVLFVLSEDWVESKYCRFELDHAVEMHKRLIPVALPPELDPGTLPLALRDLSWIPLGTEVDGSAIERVSKALDTDLEWRDQHARLLVRAGEWEAAGNDKSLLLRGSDLRSAEAWLAGEPPHGETAAPRHTTFILASRRAATRRQRVALGLVAVALLVALGLAGVALWQRNVARDNQREAEQQRRVAERNARESRSRELAAKATAQLDADPELALLLGIEAANAAPTAQAGEVLRAAMPRTNRARVLAHSGLQDVATDAGGSLAITGGTDGLGRTWDLATGKRLAVLRGHSPDQQTDVTQGVLAVAISADGGFAATGGAEGDVRIWVPRSGRLLHTLHAPTGGGSDLGISLALAGAGDDAVLVTAGQSGDIRTWDPASGRPINRTRLDRHEVVELAVSGDGRRIAAASLPQLDGKGVVAVYNAATLAPVSRFGTTAFHLAFSHDGRRLITDGLGSFAVWDADSGALERRLPGSPQGGGMAFSPDARLLAIAPGGDEVTLLDAASGERRRTLRHPGIVSAVAFSADGRKLVTAGTDKTARLWDVGSGRLLQTLRGHRTPVWHAAFLGDTARLLTAAGDGTARIWSPAAASAPRALRGHSAVVDDLALAAGGRRLITASEDGTARVWEPSSGHPIATVDHGSGTIDASVSVSPDGKTFATAGAAPARLWSAEDARPLATIPGDSGGAAMFTRDGRYLVTRSGKVWDIRRERAATPVGEFLAGPVPVRDGTEQAVFGTRLGGAAVIIAVPSGKRLARLDAKLRDGFASAAVSSDSRVLALESAGNVTLWDVASGERIGALPSEAKLLSAAAFAPRGDRLLTAGQTGVRVWDVARRRPITDLPHPRPIGSAAFSRDGRFVVTASFDGLVRIWEARTGQLIVRAPGRSRQTWNEGFAPRAVFAPDGRTVVAATGGSSAFVDQCTVCAPLPELLEQAREATSRELTRDERLTYLAR
jgi:WD40 repeat protein